MPMNHESHNRPDAFDEIAMLIGVLVIILAVFFLIGTVVALPSILWGNNTCSYESR